MKNIISILIFTVISFSFSEKTSATHIYGGELTYSYISGNSYKITLTLYGDCAGSAFDGLKAATPSITLYNNGQRYAIYNLTENLSLRQEVSAVCPSELNNTTCQNSSNPLPGVTKFVYERTVSLAPSPNWLIAFEGRISANNLAGRSGAISNLVNANIMRLEAMLNNEKAPNSSPEYTTTPTPYYCINIDQEYNQGALDPDRDSLYFALVPATDSFGNQLQYQSPYTALSPMASNYFSFSHSSGQIKFYPNLSQQSLIVNQVLEYRDGVLVGSSMREMTFIVLSNCNNNPPNSHIDTASISAGTFEDNTITLCNRVDELSFTINANDTENDIVSITTSGVPSGATANISNNNTDSPTINFSWPLKDIQAGYYNLYITLKDDHCPLIGTKTIAYSIRVFAPVTISSKIVKETQCAHKQIVEFNITGGQLPRDLSLYDANNDKLLRNYTDSTGSILDSFDVGSYILKSNRDTFPCNSSYAFQVIDGGAYPESPKFEHLHHCLYDNPTLLSPQTTDTSGSIRWYTQDGSELNTAPTYNTNNVQQYRWLVSQQVGVCESVKDTLTVSIHGFPEIKALNERGNICYGTGIYLLASGGIRYEWTPSDLIEYKGDSPYTIIYEPSTFVVTGYSPYNCPNTDTLTYNKIEQCCTFSYPNAFTPNKDGNNDGWKPVVYGNVTAYLLSIYNRWGERVFVSSNPYERWDGTYAGKKCDMGTYFYYFRSDCSTGSKETASGELILIR